MKTLPRLLACFLLAACAGLAQAQSAAPAKLKFVLDWKFQGLHAWFITAQEKGYFAQEGLDVTIDSGDGSAAAVTKVATRLTEAGLLMRRRDDRDHRLVRLWLTDAGRALQEPVEAERRLMEEKLTADLTETEREHLMKALAKIHESATDLLGSTIDHDEPAVTWSEEQ